MSFNLFIYYRAISGAWAAWIAWALGRILAPAADVPRALVQGLLLGLLVALATSLVDAWGDLATGQYKRLVTRLLVAAGIGSMGGVLGAGLGQLFLRMARQDLLVPVSVVLGWCLTGLLIGVATGAYEVVDRFVRGEDLRGAVQKMVHGLIGGGIGGVLGSVLYLLVRWGLARHLARSPDEVASSSAIGLVALGLCIGLFVGLAQVLYRAGENTFRFGERQRHGRAASLIGKEGPANPFV